MVDNSPKLRRLERQQQKLKNKNRQQQLQLQPISSKKTNAIGRLFQRNKKTNVKKLKKAPLSNYQQQQQQEEEEEEEEGNCMDNHNAPCGKSVSRGDFDSDQLLSSFSSSKRQSLMINKQKSIKGKKSSSSSHAGEKKQKDPSDLLLLYDDTVDPSNNEQEEYYHTVDDDHDEHPCNRVAAHDAMGHHSLQKVELNNSGEYGTDMGCTLENAWNMLCQDDPAVPRNHHVEASHVAQQFQVRVDVMQDLSPEELVGLGLQHDLYVGNGSGHEIHHDQQRNESEIMMLTRSALSRPFGRTSLPAHLAKRWVVQVSFVGYNNGDGDGDDNDEIGECLYNVMVQVEDPGSSSYGGTPTPSPMRGGGTSSLVAASVDRTLNDFIWLEDALLQEYRGSLIFPMLSLAVTSWADLDITSPSWTPTMQCRMEGIWDPVKASMHLMEEAMHSKEPLDTKLLADWLNDVLNSVRGKGELILNHKMDEVIHSEAMETFLYKTSSSLPKPRRKIWYDRKSAKGSPLLDFRNVLQLQDSSKDCVQSALAGIVKANLKCLGIMDRCDVAGTRDECYMDGSGEVVLPRKNSQHGKNDYSGKLEKSHESESLSAQRFYIATQKENTLRAMYCLRMLLDKEILLSAAWKRLAISLSMLFAAEKDIEGCKVATTKTSTPGKSIKIDKETVDDNLRILARQKVDRSIPSLKVLSGMLNAYYADFSSVDPSLDEYATSIQNIITPNSHNGGGWQSQLKAISPVKLLSLGSDGSGSSSNTKQQEMERQETRQKLAANEEHMISSLTQLCKATKIRTARMSWKYFKMELGQVSLLLSACEQSRTNLSRATASAQNEVRVDVEKAHFDRETELVKLIMELGLRKKYKYSPIPKSSCGSSHTSSETSDVSEFDKSREGDSETMTTEEWGTVQAKVVENILSLSKEYAGRWNQDFTVKMLEASGIPNVSFDTEDAPTKNIRTVLKLATTLSESMERCKKAVEMLKAFGVEDENHDSFPMHVLRHNFQSELVRVFSCTCHPSSKTMNMNASWERILSSMGVDIHDSAGWLKREEVRGGGQCGPATVKYQAMRNHGVHDFICLLEERLKSYHVLMEEIDNYIWMHRVGDYIEKYYSNVRAQAVAAWEKKTDITTAITIATKKKLMLLVKELKEKLELIGDSVSYSSVREAKERHLGSKALKGELESLACRRFQTLKETCTDHSLSIINEWTLREESIAKIETKYLNEIIREIESNVRRHENAIQADGGAHLFAVSLSRKPSSSTTRSSSHSSPQRVSDGLG